MEYAYTAYSPYNFQIRLKVKIHRFLALAQKSDAKLSKRNAPNFRSKLKLKKILLWWPLRNYNKNKLRQNNAGPHQSVLM